MKHFCAKETSATHAPLMGLEWQFSNSTMQNANVVILKMYGDVTMLGLGFWGAKPLPFRFVFFLGIWTSLGDPFKEPPLF